MNPLQLDHIGFIVEDLDAARGLFQGLGFTLTPRADHTRRDAAGQVVPAGSAQHSAMFDTGYIELMQITDAAAGHPLTPAMRERFGLHVLALGTEDATRCHAERQRADLAVRPVMDWSRPVATPERSGLARFIFFDLPWSPGDPSYICWVQHATPQLLRSPSLLRHANGVHTLRGLEYRGSTASLLPWAHRLEQAGAIRHAHPIIAGGLRMGLDGCWIDLRPDDTRPRTLPVGVTLGLPDPEALADRARRLGLAVRPAGDGAIEIDLSAPCGLQLLAAREPRPGTALHNATHEP